MLDLVGNPNCWFSRVNALILFAVHNKVLDVHNETCMRNFDI